MRDLMSTLATAIISTGVGSGATYMVVNTTTCTTTGSIQTSVSTTKVNPKITNNFGGEDNYVIHWTGQKGTQFTGSATFMYPDGRPIKSYVITKTLPHTYKLSAIKNTTVSAMGVEPGVKVKILKNGVECGESTVEGNAIGENKICY